MNRGPHCSVGWLAALAWIFLTPGCSGDSSVGLDVLRDADASDVTEVTPEVVSDPDAGAEDVEDVEDVVVTLEVSAPDTAPDVAPPVGPPEDLPEGKATWSCQVDVECAGCAGSGECVDGVCRYDGGGCVVADPSGPWASCVTSGASAPGSSCLQCTPSVADDRWSGAWVSADFEVTLSPFAQQAVLGSPEAVWEASPARAFGGLQSAHFGDPDAGTYASTDRSWARISTAPFVTDNGLSGTLRFWLWLETEETPGFDVLRVLSIRDKVEDELWTSDVIGGTTLGEWTLIEVDVSGPPEIATQLVIEFDTRDDILNDLEGAYIDGLTFATGCCSADADCVTTDACLQGSCGADGLCEWAAIEGCCNEALDCETSGPCFLATCTGAGGTCGEEPVEGCCETPFDCIDGDPCTEDVCPWPGGLCDAVILCCNQDSDCSMSDPCFVGSCVNDECIYEDECCETDADCEDGDACTVGSCVQSMCLMTLLPLEGCCTETVLLESFDSGLALGGWTLAGITNGVGWSVADPSVSGLPSPPGALYYGNPLTWSYNSGGSNHGTARLPYITLPLGVEVHLRFTIFLEVETSGLFDDFSVQVNGPSGWQTLLTKPELIQSQWQQVDVDVSALAGQSVQFAFHFDTVSAFDNDGLGVLIDDLSVTTTCLPRPCVAAIDCPSTDVCLHGVCLDGACSYVDSCCQSDADCDDGDLCTTDTCNQEQTCVFTPVADCCTNASDCHDGDICTLDVCTSYGGTCINPDIAGCCHDSGECDDGEPCTVDQCLENVCVHGWSCCESDAECDDGDDVCTLDECVDSFCVYAPSGLEGCCLAQPVFWDFETPVDFALTGTTPPCAWYITNVGTSSSGTVALYYGDPGTMTFACDQNAGMATSPEITLMAGFAYTLTFEANLDVESNTIYDTLDLYAVLANGQKILIWDKSAMVATDQWFTYEVDLGAFEGQTFRLLFDFNTHDAVANDATGIYIDDLRVTSTCLAKPCTDDLVCNDDIAATSETCGLSGCEYTLP